MTRRRRAAWVVIYLVALVPALTHAQPPRGKRVKPPSFEPASVDGVFFPDVFSVLVGPRPDPRQAASSPAPSVGIGGANAAPEPAGGSSEAWSQWVSASTLENEIKAIKLLVDQEVNSVSAFAGRGYIQCRRLFSVAAVVFAVAEKFDKDVRWRSDAAGLRGLFARTAFNCKTGDKRVFDQAKERKAELEDLLNGQVPDFGPVEPLEDWSQVADRAPLMQRLEIALDRRMQALIGDERSFGSQLEELKHEAEIVAMFGEALTRAEMNDSDDDAYREYAHRMRDAARQVARAAETADYAVARAAVGEIGKACADCHGAGYR